MKKALLIGINYRGTSSELNGCINDILEVQNTLKNQYKYTDFEIMTDDTIIKPTKINMINSFKKIVTDSSKYSEIWIHYSGHGTYVTDKNGDEKDKQDEAIVPIDYLRSGLITDDDLNPIISKTQCRTRIVMDSCHSGTVFDFQYNVICQNNEFVNFLEKKTTNNKNNILMISGCKDNQTSKENFDPVTSKVNGALTYNLSNYMKTNKYNLKMNDLLKNLYGKLSEYDQNPVLSSNSEINIENSFMVENNKSKNSKKKFITKRRFALKRNIIMSPIKLSLVVKKNQYTQKNRVITISKPTLNTTQKNIVQKVVQQKKTNPITKNFTVPKTIPQKRSIQVKRNKF